jgi:acid phosphatase (class A)
MTMCIPGQNGLHAFLAVPLAMISLTLAGCMASQANATDCPPTDDLVTDVPELAPGSGFLIGYLKHEQVPNSLTLLPPPPKDDSTAFANDEAVSKVAYGLRDTPRWQQATLDAKVKMPDMTVAFSCALGVPISKTDTPNLIRMMSRVFTDTADSTEAAKHEYKRQRPFMVHNEGTCTPESEEALRGDPSYPSGHTAIGYAWMLTLVEAAPDRIDALVARGRAFGESRMVCNAHWQSDVLQGRAMGTVTMARLHAEPAFRADMRASIKDIAAARAKGLKPNNDCVKEAEALKQPIPGVL